MVKVVNKYEKEINSNFADVVIQYGIIYGDSKLFFIKVGQDGSIYGYNDKYVKMAERINKKYGCTVVVSSNPYSVGNPLENAMEVINELGFEDYEIYYFGHSKGALFGAWFGYMYSRIKRRVLVNGPLMYNFHKTKEDALDFGGDRLTFVYGDNDQSFKYTELLTAILNDKIKLEIMENNDHHFSNSFDDFQMIPDKFLFYDFKER